MALSLGVVATLLGACAVGDRPPSAVRGAFDLDDRDRDRDRERRPGPSIGEIEAAIDRLFYRREAFDPSLCQSEVEGAFVAMLGGRIYNVPLDAFLVGRSTARARSAERSARAGCPEAPFAASALTFAADGVPRLAGAGAYEAATLQVTVVTNQRQRTLERRAARVLALTLSDACDAASGEPGFLRCETEEPIAASLERMTYFVAATADAPSIGRAPFAVRCLDRRVARRCSIVDRLDEDALIAIDFDPDAAELADSVELHRRVLEWTRSLRRGLPT